MLASAIIVFREVLEASLIVGIVMAAARGVAGRGLWVAAGIAGGLVGAGLVALFAEKIADLASGMGQEIFNAAILFAAVLMLGWHNVWMGRHGQELAADAKTLGSAVAAGDRPLYALATVIGLAVLREGAEVVLFLYGIAASDGGGPLPMLGGGAIGVLAGSVAGAALYLGLLRIPMRHLFAVTSALILLLAAGMAASAAAFLVQADLLPTLGDAVWDSSAIIDDQSIAGKALHALLGYVARPAGVQLLFFAATVLVIGGLMRAVRLSPAGAPSARRASFGVVLLAAGLAAGDAQAEFKVRHPLVVEGELELEHNGSVTFDKSKSGRNNGQSYTNEIGYGVTSWWQPEIEGEWAADPGSNLRFEATTFENTFMLTEPGAWWLNLGFFAEYSHAADRNSADSFKFGPLIEKELGRTLLTANLFVAKEVGKNRSDASEFSYALQGRYFINPYFEPGIEAYGQVADFESPGKLADQQHRVGPVFLGTWKPFDIGRVRYEAGYLFGLTRATETGAIRWKLEYEIFF